MDPALPARAADLLLQAQHVYIYAPDASCGLASIFCYRARRLGIQPVLLEGGSAIYEYMVNITGNDLVLLFSFSRLLGETRILLDHCNKIKLPGYPFYRPFCDSGRNAVQTDFLLLSRRTK